MKNYASNKILKKIALILTIIMVFNFAMPNFSKATEDDGGILFTPVSGLLKTVSDLIIKGVQKIFTGDGEIKEPTVNSTKWQTASDFEEWLKNTKSYEEFEQGILEFAGYNSLEEMSEAGYDVYNVTLYPSTYFGYLRFNEGDYYEEGWGHHYAVVCDQEGKTYTSKDAWQDWLSTGACEDIELTFDSLNNIIKIESLQVNYSIKYGPGVIFSGTLPVFDINFINPMETTNDAVNNVEEDGGELKLSSAKVLRNVISRWYQDLQKISLIGLLSVLVYVAIRMIISSTGQDKAKYKKMLMDWLVAMCIIFMLHYIMVFVLNITNSINEIFSTTAIGENGEDQLMTYMRNQIGSEENYLEIFANIIMYMALVIFTIMFTIQYLKRVVYMAFLTIIAPLIALTYPLDKIKDGQAQAFSMWIREYIFNALIQSIHLMLYVVLVGSAIELMETYPLLAVIAVGFLVPGEKFFRDMFGFNKADSVSTLGSVAGGAAVMSMINNIKGGKGSKQKNEGKEEKSGIERIRTRNPLGALQNSNNIDAENINSSINGIRQEMQNESNLQEKMEQAEEEKILTNAIEEVEQEERTKAQKRRDGIKQVLKGKPKSFTKKAIRFVGKTAGGAALGTIGIAAGVTSGDFEKTLGYGAGGAVAGRAIGGRLADGAINAPKNVENAIHGIQDTYREGAYDKETAQNMKFDRQFKRSEKGKELVDKYSENAIQECLEAGIIDPDEMSKILKNFNSGKAGHSLKEAIAYNHLAQNCPDSILNGTPSNLQRYLSLRGIEVDESKADEIQKIMSGLK